MPIHVQAIRSLHLTYTWAGVWTWLRSPDVRIPGAPPMRGPGWALWLARPTHVRNWGEALADGVFV